MFIFILSSIQFNLATSVTYDHHPMCKYIKAQQSYKYVSQKERFIEHNILPKTRWSGRVVKVGKKKKKKIMMMKV